MRNPIAKAFLSLGFSALGVGLALLAPNVYTQTGKAVSGVLLVVGMCSALIFLFTFLWSILSAVGYTRLMNGKGEIARWHVTADEWDRFRTLDETRAAEHPFLRNDLRVRRLTPPRGVNVIVGGSNIIVDGSYHSISGGTLDGRKINWLSAPFDSECIEFPKCYARSKGGTIDVTLRVPVPASARSEGVRIFEHFHSKKQI